MGSKLGSNNLIGTYVRFYYPFGSCIIKILSVLLLLIGLFGTFIYLSKDKAPWRFGIYVVMSESMEPYIYKDDIVIVKPQDSFQKDDVITFYKTEEKKEVVTHRIVEVTTKGNEVAFKTKGDNNESTDSSYVQRSLVIGKVDRVIKDWGVVVTFLRSSLGLILFLIIPMTMVFTMILMDTVAWINSIYKENSHQKV